MQCAALWTARSSNVQTVMRDYVEFVPDTLRYVEPVKRPRPLSQDQDSEQQLESVIETKANDSSK